MSKRLKRKLGAVGVAGFLVSAGFVATPLIDVAGATAVCYDNTTATEVTAPAGTTLTLNHHVTGCLGHGLKVTGSNFTLDLGGNTVSGDSNVAQAHAGIWLAGVSNVTVKNGTVTAFNSGVFIDGGSNNTVDNVDTTANIGPGWPVLGPHGEGILVKDSSDNTIKNSSVLGNGPYGGIYLVGDSNTNVVNNNVVDGQAVPDGTPMQDDGIRLEPRPSGSPDTNQITNNVVKGSNLDGIAILQSQAPVAGPVDNVITGNTVEANRRDGIRLFASPAAGAHTCPVTPSTAHCDTSTTSNDVKNNVVCDNVGDGIAVYGHDNVIHNNQSGDGLAKPTGSPGLPGPCLPNGANGTGSADLFDRHAGCDNDWGVLGTTANTSTRKNPSTGCIA